MTLIAYAACVLLSTRLVVLFAYAACVLLPTRLVVLFAYAPCVFGQVWAVASASLHTMPDVGSVVGLLGSQRKRNVSFFSWLELHCVTLCPETCWLSRFENFWNKKVNVRNTRPELHRVTLCPETFWLSRFGNFWNKKENARVVRTTSTSAKE